MPCSGGTLAKPAPAPAGQGRAGCRGPSPGLRRGIGLDHLVAARPEDGFERPARGFLVAGDQYRWFATIPPAVAHVVMWPFRRRVAVRRLRAVAAQSAQQESCSGARSEPANRKPFAAKRLAPGL